MTDRHYQQLLDSFNTKEELRVSDIRCSLVCFLVSLFLIYHHSDNFLTIALSDSIKFCLSDLSTDLLFCKLTL